MARHSLCGDYVAALVNHDLNGHGSRSMSCSGNRRILRHWHFGGFAVQHAAVDYAAFSRRGRQRFLEFQPAAFSTFYVHPPAFFVAGSENSTVDRVDQHVDAGWLSVVTGEDHHVIEHQTGLCQFTGPFPMFANQAAFENLSRSLTDRDLNRAIHRDPCQTRELGLSFRLLFALSGRTFTVCKTPSFAAGSAFS